MATISETGHAKNVAAFENLITVIESFGESYNPPNDKIKLEALKALLSTSQESLNAVNIANASNKNTIATRKVLFAPFSKFITRVNNSLKSTSTTIQIDDTALTIVRKLQGRRAGATLTDEEKAALEAEGKTVNQISTSQLSFDNKIENFDKLITLLESVPEYTPNEEDLKIDALKTLHTNMKVANIEVLKSTASLNNARIIRNETLYKSLSGLVDIAYDTKNYIKSIFGATDPRYKLISSLRFVNRA